MTDPHQGSASAAPRHHVLGQMAAWTDCGQPYARNGPNPGTVDWRRVTCPQCLADRESPGIPIFVGPPANRVDAIIDDPAAAPRSEPGGPAEPEARDSEYPYGEFDASKWAAEFFRLYDTAMNRREAADRAAPASPTVEELEAALNRIDPHQPSYWDRRKAAPGFEPLLTNAGLAKALHEELGRAAPRSVEAGLPTLTTLRLALSVMASGNPHDNSRYDSGDYGPLERPSEFARRIVDEYAARLSAAEGTETP